MAKRNTVLKLPTATEEPDPWVCGSQIKAGRYSFLYPPYIPYGAPVLLTGRKGVGKSSFQGFLASKAKRTLFMPGEEGPEESIAPRMAGYGIDPKRWAVLEPESQWMFPACIERFGRMLERGGFDLVIADPIGPYCKFNPQEDMNEQIRRMINDLRKTLTPLKIAFVMCRHPGKAKDNMIQGHSSWGDTPRVVLEMLRDPGPPKRLIIRAEKYQVGTEPAPRYYTLPCEPKQFPKWELGEEIPQETVEGVKEEQDRSERGKIDEAVIFLRCVLANGAMSRKEIMLLACKEGLGERPVRRASDRLLVERTPCGKGADHKMMWSLPKDGTEKKTKGGGGAKGDGQSRRSGSKKPEKPGKKGKV